MSPYMTIGDANNILTELQNITDGTNVFHGLKSFTVNHLHFGIDKLFEMLFCFRTVIDISTIAG